MKLAVPKELKRRHEETVRHEARQTLEIERRRAGVGWTESW